MERILRRPSSLVVTDMRGAPLRGTLSSEGEWLLPVPAVRDGALDARRRSRDRGQALLRAPRHGLALRRARRAARTWTEGRVVSGASTITSQVVRLAVPRERTIPNKLLEFTQAAALEFILTKDEILEIYLNSVPFGGNTRGVEAAARTWFGKSAKELSLAEAALLTALLRGPSYYRPDPPPGARARTARQAHRHARRARRGDRGRRRGARSSNRCRRRASR